MADVTINQLTSQAPTTNDLFPFSTAVSPSTYKASLAQIKTALGLSTVASTGSYADLINKPTIPKFAYAVLSQIGTAPYTVTTLASAHVQSISVNASTADITINWTTDHFNDANYCVTMGTQALVTGNRSHGINIQTGSASKTRNSVIVMAGSVSNGQFYASSNINILAIQ